MKKIENMNLNEYVEMRKQQLQALALKHYKEEIKELELLGQILINDEFSKTKSKINRKSFKLWISYMKKAGMEKTCNEINNSQNNYSYIEGMKYVISWLDKKNLTIRDHKIVMNQEIIC